MQILSGMDRARNALERGDRLPGGSLPGPIAESWQRCRDLGLDPRLQPRGEVVPFATVTRRRQKMEGLRRLALAEMQVLYAQIAGSNLMIALADASGMVLDTISDQAFTESTAGRSIIPGSLWDEARRGTNALGLASDSSQPVGVFGREHYFTCHAHLSCMAAPILDSHGQVLGLLDASCANEARQQHTHALVRMAAAQIENGLIFQECADKFILAFHPRAEYLDTLSAGLLALSREGVVTALNRPGSALLSGLPIGTGTSFDTLFEMPFARALDGLLRGGVIPIRDAAGSQVLMVCRQIAPGLAVRNLHREPKVPVHDKGGAALGFVCMDPTLKAAMADIGQAVAMGMPIHLTGETGTGKELMARHVHEVSGRGGEFIAVNCGALAEQLFVAEIFGHEQGAFTNARAEGSIGLARQADGGTLFLDEVADVPLSAQTALLRFLDAMEVRPVGGLKIYKVDVQIISATNRNLEKMVAERTFRADLLYRLNGLVLHLPPLSARSDFALVVKHLLQGLAPGVAITDAALARLAQREWPGNIRELRSVLQRLLIRRRAGVIDETDLADTAAGSGDTCPACRDRGLASRICREIRATYRTCQNVTRTAQMLGLSRTTIYKHL
ncbi:sigma-54-dependent Fis family transcriptional regulator [Labrys sp. KNU-23]|uniref:sigma-54-dependent Fis family transcriptional regulator n=1 Tax=Labrys sp. KNU-23 TaxID=2789216 RepID=UPI0011ECBB38|nr:sigma-54-dependent Fis family transcriptional regulator [Labrys sp. KNU-23]QEN85903.1 sigma-54-dependent Fis family transcriptional regulator [Labrys sp. KNU-23]